jgi:hypothetical protein
MTNQMAPNVLPAIVLLAAVGAILLRAAARRPGPQAVPGTGPVPAVVKAGEHQSRPALTVGTHDGTGPERARLPAPWGRSAVSVEQTQHIFHELHAAGRNTLCAVCDSQYE